MSHHHDPIDRLTPTLPPEQPVVMHQNWHHLLFLHWEVPVDELQRLIPPELTVDTFEGKAYVTVLPFTVTGARPVMLPAVPWLSDFHEVNVRTYVHLRGQNPGVWFFSLDASSVIAAAGARAVYKLPYTHAHIEMNVKPHSIEFLSHRDDDRAPMPAHIHTRYEPQPGLLGPAKPGSLDHFLVERYILYSVSADHQLHQARVSHQPYPLQSVEVPLLEETLVWAAGLKRAEAPPLAHYASEVNVRVFPLEKAGGSSN